MMEFVPVLESGVYVLGPNSTGRIYDFNGIQVLEGGNAEKSPGFTKNVRNLVSVLLSAPTSYNIGTAHAVISGNSEVPVLANVAPIKSTKPETIGEDFKKIQEVGMAFRKPSCAMNSKIEPIIIHKSLNCGELLLYVLAGDSKDGEAIAKALSSGNDEELNKAAAAHGSVAVLVWRPAENEKLVTRVLISGTCSFARIAQALERGSKYLPFLNARNVTAKEAFTVAAPKTNSPASKPNSGRMSVRSSVPAKAPTTRAVPTRPAPAAAAAKPGGRPAPRAPLRASVLPGGRVSSASTAAERPQRRVPSTRPTPTAASRTTASSRAAPVNTRPTKAATTTGRPASKTVDNKSLKSADAKKITSVNPIKSNDVIPATKKQEAPAKDNGPTVTKPKEEPKLERVEANADDKIMSNKDTAVEEEIVASKVEPFQANVLESALESNEAVAPVKTSEETKDVVEDVVDSKKLGEMGETLINTDSNNLVDVSHDLHNEDVSRDSVKPEKEISDEPSKPEETISGTMDEVKKTENAEDAREQNQFVSKPSEFDNSSDNVGAEPNTLLADVSVIDNDKKNELPEHISSNIIDEPKPSEVENNSSNVVEESKKLLEDVSIDDSKNQKPEQIVSSPSADPKPSESENIPSKGIEEPKKLLEDVSIVVDEPKEPEDLLVDIAQGPKPDNKDGTEPASNSLEDPVNHDTSIHNGPMPNGTDNSGQDSKEVFIPQCPGADGLLPDCGEEVHVLKKISMDTDKTQSDLEQCDKLPENGSDFTMLAEKMNGLDIKSSESVVNGGEHSTADVEKANDCSNGVEGSGNIIEQFSDPNMSREAIRALVDETAKRTGDMDPSVPPLMNMIKKQIGTHSVYNGPKLSRPYYFDYVTVPHNDENQCTLDEPQLEEFMKKIRSLHYILPSVDISEAQLDAIIKGRTAMVESGVTVKIHPTHDSPIIRGMPEEKKNLMDDTKTKLGLVINLQKVKLSVKDGEYEVDLARIVTHD